MKHKIYRKNYISKVWWRKVVFKRDYVTNESTKRKKQMDNFAIEVNSINLQQKRILE